MANINTKYLDPVEKWLNRLTKTELLHLVRWTLDKPRYYQFSDESTAKEWIVDSIKRSREYQTREHALPDGHRYTNDCDMCEDICRKLLGEEGD